MNLPRSKLLAALGLIAFLGAVAFLSHRRRAPTRPAAELLPYQARTTELPAAEQQRFAEIRTALRAAERARWETKKWPDAFSAPGLTWIQRGQGLYVNYLGIPTEPSRLRWLVLFIEPEPTALKDRAPPEDEEHHTLPDGTALHLSVWSAPNEGPVPSVVLPFPAAENWTQQVGAPTNF